MEVSSEVTATAAGDSIEVMEVDEVVPIPMAGKISAENGELENSNEKVDKISQTVDDECVVVSELTRNLLGSSVIEENPVPADPVTTVSDSIDTVQPVTKAPPSSAQMINFLLATRKQSCESVEAAALDFVADLHHPVVTCFREISKTDIYAIFNHARFRSELMEFEQGITCITFMDYIATSLKNPMYSETLSKSEASVRLCVKKVFLELRRLFRDWAVRDSSSFSSGKKMILKCLRNLTPYFKSIEYDTAYKSAVDLLEKDAARAQRSSHKPSLSASDRSALVEIMSNAPHSGTNEEANKEIKIKAGEVDHDLSDEIFDILDEAPVPPKKLSSVLLKPKFSNSCKQTTLNWFKAKPKSGVLPQDQHSNLTSKNNNSDSPLTSSVSSVSVAVPNKSASKTEKLMIKRSATDSVAQKRPPAPDFEIIESPSKKLCVTNSSNSISSVPVSDNGGAASSSVNTSSTTLVLGCSPEKSSDGESENPAPLNACLEVMNPDKTPEPPKQKVNAFAFLMNRSKEIAKEKKVKKQAATIAHAQKNTSAVNATN